MKTVLLLWAGRKGKRRVIEVQFSLENYDKMVKEPLLLNSPNMQVKTPQSYPFFCVGICCIEDCNGEKDKENQRKEGKGKPLEKQRSMKKDLLVFCASPDGFSQCRI